MRKYAFVVVASLVLSLSGGIGLADRDVRSDPVAAAGASPVFFGGTQDLDGTIEALQATLRRLPRDDRSWATLGLAYVEQARLTGNPAYYRRADLAVARSYQLRPTQNFSVLTADAAIHAARHDFAEALRLADAALRINPRDAAALSIRVDALTELGRYPEQLRALQVADSRQPGVAVAARFSYAYELRGHLGRAAAILHRAAQSASHADRAFLLTLLADIQRRDGRLVAAAAALDRVRRELPGYLPAMVSQARLDTARGDLRSAATTWRGVVARLALPEYVSELGELYLHLGHPRLAANQFKVVRSTMTLFARNGVNTDLESALFAADHGSPRRALADARAEWKRRHSIHVADVLGWALHRSGRSASALRFARRATRLGSPEAKLWIHRGTIEAALGRTAAARADLTRGLETDPGLSPWQSDRARAILRSLAARS